MTVVILRSASRAEDAGYLALADVAAVTEQLNADYRLIGGHMVTLLVVAHQVTGVPTRTTSDADLGADFSVVSDDRLIEALTELGYGRPEASNRFIREIDHETKAVIDILAPSFTGKHEPNQPHGNMVVDEIPGLSYALAAPPTQITVTADLTTGAQVTTTVLLPSPWSALCLKLLAWGSRVNDKDATDIWRLLAVCDAAGIRPAQWPTTITSRDALEVLRQITRPGSLSLRRLTPDRATQTRIRALAHRVTGIG